MQSYPPAAQDLVDRMRAAAAADRDAALAFQGGPGAYSHQAVLSIAPDGLPLPCYSFEDAIAAVVDGSAARAVIPVENSLHGRVADVHFLLPESGLFIAGETYVKVEHCLLGLPDATLADIREVLSHPQALGQCRHRLKAMGLRPVAHADTAAAAAEVMSRGDRTIAAIASRLAGKLYGCRVLAENLEDASHNRTRFLVLSRTPVWVGSAKGGGREDGGGKGDGRQGDGEGDGAGDGAGAWKSTFAFEVKNIPAALYKALGGFATNGVNLTRLESHLSGGSFTAAQFLIDIEGRPDQPGVARALEELAFHSKWVRLLGTYRTGEPAA